MQISIPPTTASRIRDAWAKLTPDQKNRIMPLFQAGHQKTLTVAHQQIAPSVDESIGTPLNLAMTALTSDSANILDLLQVGIVITVDGGGEIWGTGKYEALDVGWLESLVRWMENIVKPKQPFNPNPVLVTIPDNVTIAVAGDWGTGEWRSPANPSPSTKVCKQIKTINPDITIHLGDVYYAGTEDEEFHILTKTWPSGPLGSFALNSNHEMYSAGIPYFAAIANAPFAKQGSCSFFALENNNWIIVGLDSAYYADEYSMYRDGSLTQGGKGQEQIAFLQAQIARGKKIILLTHHNGLSDDGRSQTGLWSQVMNVFPAGRGPDYWYWGHAHLGVIYAPQNGTQPRCCGHGALPCGPATDLNHSNQILWHEEQDAHDSDIPDRILNGFATLTLAGTAIKETFYNENGSVASPVPPLPRPISSVPLAAVARTAALRTAAPSAAPQKSSLTVRIFDGTRQESSANNVLITITDGNSHQLVRRNYPSGTIFNLPFYNNFGDDYTVMAFLDGCLQAGFSPVKCRPNNPQTVDIMLLPKNSDFRFPDAKWQTLISTHPALCKLFSQGAVDAQSAADRYTELMEKRPASLACLFNITTAMSAISLPVGTPLDYFQELIWDNTMAQDRFYGWADPALYDQVKQAAIQNMFVREPGFALFHKGATDSYKQIQFGEANVQLTFHQNDTKQINGKTHIKMELDMDYYKDLGAHGILEALGNLISGSLTDPRQVYLLRWIAGRRAGVPEFNPPYTIA